MKYLVILVTQFWSLVLSAQDTASLPANGIYLSDSAYIRHELQGSFDAQKGAGIHTARKDFLTLKTDSSERRYFYSEIWGYRRDGRDWRVYNGESYKIDFVGPVCIYDLPGSSQGAGIPVTYHFSRTLAGPVYTISKNNLMHVYHDDTGFVNKVNHLGMFRSIFRWDKRRHNYAFVNWIKK